MECIPDMNNDAPSRNPHRTCCLVSPNICTTKATTIACWAMWVQHLAIGPSAAPVNTYNELVRARLSKPTCSSSATFLG